MQVDTSCFNARTVLFSSLPRNSFVQLADRWDFENAGENRNNGGFTNPRQNLQRPRPAAEIPQTAPPVPAPDTRAVPNPQARPHTTQPSHSRGIAPIPPHIVDHQLAVVVHIHEEFTEGSVLGVLGERWKREARSAMDKEEAAHRRLDRLETAGDLQKITGGYADTAEATRQTGQDTLRSFHSGSVGLSVSSGRSLVSGRGVDPGLMPAYGFVECFREGYVDDDATGSGDVVCCVEPPSRAPSDFHVARFVWVLAQEPGSSLIRMGVDGLGLRAWAMFYVWGG